jgi:hypothetical protein
VERCHLSNTVGDYLAVEMVDVRPVQRFDIAADFVLWGSIQFFDERGRCIEELPFDMPPPWVVWELQRGAEPGTMVRIPLPKLFQAVDAAPRPIIQ